MATRREQPGAPAGNTHNFRCGHATNTAIKSNSENRIGSKTGRPLLVRPLERAMSKRIIYLVFLFSLFLFSEVFRSSPEKLEGPAGEQFSESQRYVHYLVVGVIAIGTGWFSFIQLKRDWKTLRDRKKK